MKKSYKSFFHIYFIFLFFLIGMIIAGASLVFYMITIQKPNGQIGLSNWPKYFVEDFEREIIFVKDKPQLKQSGLEELQNNDLWIQIIDESGMEVFSYKKPEGIANHYSCLELLQFPQTGGDANTSIFIGNTYNGNQKFAYIIGFPVKISKVTMYLDANKFTSGKPIFIGVIGSAFLIVIIAGFSYGYWVTKQLSRMTKAVVEVAERSYLQIQDHGSFGDIYDSINALDSEIWISDEKKAKDEKIREEWIANITHDLKTPLSSIKGYVELMMDNGHLITIDKMQKYVRITLKNVAYAESIIDDLKLTYQLENGMILLQKSKGNLSRFLKELIIDILNHPDYQLRNISFCCDEKAIEFYYEPKLLTRAFNNILINEIIHNSQETEVIVSIKSIPTIEICIKDNGRGMNDEELSNLFTRYYRGTNTEQKTEGTGLGMAIAKQIIEFHGGTIKVESSPEQGTIIFIVFPKLN